MVTRQDRGEALPGVGRLGGTVHEHNRRTTGAPDAVARVQVAGLHVLESGRRSGAPRGGQVVDEREGPDGDDEGEDGDRYAAEATPPPGTAPFRDLGDRHLRFDHAP